MIFRVMILLLISHVSCTLEDEVSNLRILAQGGFTPMLQITQPTDTGVFVTDQPFALVSGACSSVSNLTVSGASLLGEGCQEGVFSLAPIELPMGETQVNVVAKDALGKEYTAAIKIARVASLTKLALSIEKPSMNVFHGRHANLNITGTCSQLPLMLTVTPTGTIMNDCATRGVFSIDINTNSEGTRDIKITATYQEEQVTRQVRWNYDITPPTVAITDPADDYFDHGNNIVLTGTCEAQTGTKISTDFDLVMADDDCTDGTWSTAPFNLGWERRTVTVTATDLAGNTTTATRKLTKMIVLGQPSPNVIKQMEMPAHSNLSVWTDGLRMLVTDRTRHRVLVFNQIPASPSQKPDFILGQPDLYNMLANNGGISAKSLNTPNTAIAEGSKIIVADQGNARVLIWNAWPTENFSAADVVIGADSFTQIGNANIATFGPDTLSSPASLFVDQTGGLWVSDIGDHRILKFNSVPTTNGSAADLVLGQPDFYTKGAQPISAASLHTPLSMITVGTKFIVADSGRSRILIWNALPTANYQSADVVLGQPDAVTAVKAYGGLSARSMISSSTLASDGSRLFSGDTGANRILVWNTIPTSNFTAADVVLGQANFTTGTPNYGGLSLKSLRSPEGSLSIIGGATGQLYVSDAGNARILRYSLNSLTTFMDADLVWGYDAPNGGFKTVGGLSYLSPAGVFAGAGKYFVADSGNHRVLIYDEPPLTGSVQPSVVLGQPDLWSTAANNGYDPLNPTALNDPLPTAYNMHTPTGVMTDGYRLYVTDSGNNRVLIWNSIPTANQTPASLVLGQPDMTSNTANNPSLGSQAQRLSGPRGIYAVTTDGSPANTKLLIADYLNNRVLVWPTLPTSNGEAATYAMGQADLNGIAASSANAARMNAPLDVWTNGTKVAIADSNNHRVLLFDSFPVGHGPTATTVIGQPTAATAVANNGGQSDKTLNLPSGLTSDGTRLYIADRNNHRILVYHTWPAGVQPAADSVLGQVDFSTARTTTNSDTRISQPFRVHHDGTRLFATALGTSQIHVYNDPHLANFSLSASFHAGKETEWVVYQPLDGRRLVPASAVRIGQRIYVADNNGRILVWNSIPQQSGKAADFVLGQADFSGYLANRGGSVGADTLNRYLIISTDGTRLVVADEHNHRVLIYNQAPIGPEAVPDLVLGQPDFTSALPNRGGGPTANTLNFPRSAYVFGDRVVVTDSNNRRVLIWNSIPTVNGQAADVVLGQPDMTSNIAYFPLSSATFGVTQSATWDGSNKLAIADIWNHRILIWNTFPISNFQPADVVLLQPNFESNNGTLDNNGFAMSGNVRVVDYDSGILSLSNFDRNRLLLWRGFPTESGKAPDAIYLQDDGFSLSAAFRPESCQGGFGQSMSDGLLLMSCGSRLLILPQPVVP